jgi:hypothetical protein
MFGCLAFFAVQKEHQSWKLAKTGEMVIFVGYENDGITYRIIRLSDQKLGPTCHAIFSEFEFPTLSGSTPSSSLKFSLDEENKEDIFYECDSDPIPPTPVITPAADPLLSPAKHSLNFSTPPELLPEEVVSHTIAPISCPPYEIIGNISAANVVDRPQRLRAMLVTVDADVPSFYHQAIWGPESKQWQAAIKKEITAMNDLAV